jgi:hypothetical protein
MTQQIRLTSPLRWTDDGVRPRDTCDDTAARLRVSGRRGAAPALVGQALADYWRLVAVTGIDARRALLRALREDIAAGHTTERACVPVALGDPEFDLVRDATRAYLGGWPASVDRRAQVVDEVVDWIVRGLALHPAALVCALLDGADAACLEQLERVRRRLDIRTTEAVFAAFRNGEIGAEVATFLEEWRAAIGWVDSVAA